MQASRSLLFRHATRVCQAIAVEPSTSARGFYLATLPWRLAGDGAVNQTAGARFLDSVDIVASSISTSRRVSPTAGSLALKLDSIKSQGGAWLVIKASDAQDALEKLKSRLGSTASAWDVEKVTVTSVDSFVEGTNQDGPLFVGEKEGLYARAGENVRTEGPLYGK